MLSVRVDTMVGQPNVAVKGVDIPEPEVGEVRVRVAAAAVNPIDVFTTLPGTPAIFGITDPPEEFGLGWDLAGEISAVGPGVTDWRVGDRVLGLNDAVVDVHGTQAEETLIAVDAIAALPDEIDFVSAATVPLNASTATQALDLAGLPEDGTLLVTGAAGAVGGYLLELARLRGIRTVAVAGSGDTELLRSMGADHVIERGPGLAARVRTVVPDGVDAAVDAALVADEALAAVRDGGRFVGVAGGALPAAERGIDIILVQVKADAAQLAVLVDHLVAGRISARVADTVALRDVDLAHKRLMAGGIRGRLVLVP